MGTRGRLKAYDAKTGKLKWTFYTRARPRRARPRNLAAGQRRVDAAAPASGRTPAIDPELGLIYFTTGNPGPI